MLMPFATRPAQPMYCRFTPHVAVPCFSWPVSSNAPTASPRAAAGAAAASSPATANRRTRLIAAAVVPRPPGSAAAASDPGVRSPTCSAIVHPFRFGSSLTSADTYLPACSHVCVRTKHDRSRSTSTARVRTARPASILAAAAAFDLVVLTNT